LIIFEKKLVLTKQYKKITGDLLLYSFFSGLLLGSINYFVNISIEPTNLMYVSLILIFSFPIMSTWIYARQVNELDFRSSFSVSFMTLFFGSLFFSVLLDLKEIRVFNFQDFILNLPPLMAYSFLLATFLKKKN